MGNRDVLQLSLLDQEGPIEPRLLKSGYSIVCGVDEAGRGPLAGPVIASAVVYKDTPAIGKCRDSKQLSGKRRAELFIEIIDHLVYGEGACSPQEIDKMNIRAASLEAMKRAVQSLEKKPDILLVDGKDAVPIKIESWPIIKGDARVSCIAAASIVAKVTRDRIMLEYDIKYPDYGFGQHFGYPTLKHREVIKLLGPCAIHRRSFRGVREFV